MPPRPKTTTDPVSAYAHDVLSGKILACRYVRLACERHFRDIETGHKRGIVWRPDWACYALGFFPNYLRHAKGEWAGQPVELALWQQFVIGSVFGWRTKNGLRRFRTVFEDVGRKNGKALSVTTPVATPDGWRAHGDLRPGDVVFDPAGHPIRVIAATLPYVGSCREVEFNDGNSIVAHDRHEWRVDRGRKLNELMETEELVSHLGGQHRPRIWTTAPLDLPEAQLPIPPYTLGVWLGDGSSNAPIFTCIDHEIVEAIEEEGVFVRPKKVRVGKPPSYTFSPGWGHVLTGHFRRCLREMGILGGKAIPEIYMRGSIEQRRQLLAGLIDTDGHVSKAGQIAISQVNRHLIYQIMDLACTLGFKPTLTERRANLQGQDAGQVWRLQFWATSAELPLRVLRKRANLRRVVASRSRVRQIVSCDPVGDKLVNCIEVEGGMYLASKGLIPTHNSTKLAGVGIFGLIADKEPGAEVYTAATKKDQARIIFDTAKQMARASPALREVVNVYKYNLSVDYTGSKFEPLSADERYLDGLNPHIVLIDELHKHRNRAVLDVLDTALGSRRQPILWIITTCGDDNPESVYNQESSYARQVLEDTVQDDRYFAYIATLDEGDRWDDEKVWVKANPNLNISVKLDDLRRQAQKAARSPAALVAFKRLRMNMQTKSATQFIDMDTWRLNTEGPFDPESLAGRPFFGAIDLSSRVDLTAWVKLFPPKTSGERWKIVPRFWLPADSIVEKSDRDRVQYQRWIDQGLIEITPGDVIDHTEVESAILEDCRVYDPRSIAYDPWNATQLAVSLSNEGIPVVEFRQGIRSYTAPTKELDALLVEGKLDHGGNEVLAWMAANLHVQEDKNNNVMPTKAKSVGRIDGMTALIMAIGRSMAEDLTSYLEDSDPLVF